VILHGDAGEHVVALDLAGRELDVYVVDGEPQSPLRGRRVQCDTKLHVMSRFVDWRFGVMPTT
jgi:hypothetical protein